jgi:hypothetical protein
MFLCILLASLKLFMIQCVLTYYALVLLTFVLICPQNPYIENS